MDIYLAEPRGFCAGVGRAISIVNLALEKFQPPIYVRHEIVHNYHVVKELREKGAIFVVSFPPTGSPPTFAPELRPATYVLSTPLAP